VLVDRLLYYPPEAKYGGTDSPYASPMCGALFEGMFLLGHGISSFASRGRVQATAGPYLSSCALLSGRWRLLRCGYPLRCLILLHCDSCEATVQGWTTRPKYLRS